MPIMAVQDQNDARGTARLLASTAKWSIEQSSDSPGSKVALGGLFRMLKAYQAHRFAGFEYQARDNSREGMTVAAYGESHVEELRSALDGALREAFDADQESALNTLEQTLRSVAAKNPLAPGQLEQTTDFLGLFLQKLEVAG